MQNNTGERAAVLDIGEHLRTWRGFTSFVKWSAFGVSLVMLFLVVFRTHG